MFRGTLVFLLIAVSFLTVAATEVDNELQADDSILYDDEGRLLIVTMGTGTGATSFNLTEVLTALLRNSGPFLAGAGLTALGFGIPAALLWGKGCGYGYDSGSGYGSGSGSDSGYGNSGGYSSYSSYRR